MVKRDIPIAFLLQNNFINHFFSYRRVSQGYTAVSLFKENCGQLFTSIQKMLTVCPRIRTVGETIHALRTSSLTSLFRMNMFVKQKNPFASKTNYHETHFHLRKNLQHDCADVHSCICKKSTSANLYHSNPFLCLWW